MKISIVDFGHNRKIGDPFEGFLHVKLIGGVANVDEHVAFRRVLGDLDGFSRKDTTLKGVRKNVKLTKTHKCSNLVGLA